MREDVLERLTLPVRALGEALKSLELLIDDRPQAGDVLLTQRLSDAVTDIMGWWQEMMLTLDKGGETHIENGDAEAHRQQSLARVQTLLNQIRQRYLLDLASHDRLADLYQLGRERGGEWRSWVRGFYPASESILMALLELDRALLISWQAALDQASRNIVSVQTTAIGQQIGSTEEHLPVIPTAN